MNSKKKVMCSNKIQLLVGNKSKTISCLKDQQNNVKIYINYSTNISIKNFSKLILIQHDLFQYER